MGCWICGRQEPMLLWGHKNGYHLFKCNNCGYIGVYPLPTKTELKEYYEGYFDRLYNPDLVYDKDAFKHRAKNYTSDIAEIVQFVQYEASVLDYGCGSGEFLRGMPFYRKYGYEVDPKAVDVAVQHCEMLADFPDDKFDLITMRGVIEHIPEPIEDLQQILPSLKHDGIFFISATPNSDSPAMLLYRANWKLVEPPGHIHYFNPRNLALLFARFGVALIEVKFPYLHTPYCRDDDGKAFVEDVQRYWNLQTEGEAPALPGNMMTLVFRKL